MTESLRIYDNNMTATSAAFSAALSVNVNSIAKCNAVRKLPPKYGRETDDG
jgi:hypothetical protein